jgi:choline-phosphate cytidylyltransferase
LISPFSHFTWLIVHSDADVGKYKGRVVLDYDERKEVLGHIRWVDEVIDNAPWYPTLEWMQQHNIDFVVGDEHAYEQYEALPFRPVREAGRFIPIARQEGNVFLTSNTYFPQI